MGALFLPAFNLCYLSCVFIGSVFHLSQNGSYLSLTWASVLPVQKVVCSNYQYNRSYYVLLFTMLLKNVQWLGKGGEIISTPYVIVCALSFLFLSISWTPCKASDQIYLNICIARFMNHTELLTVLANYGLRTLFTVCCNKSDNIAIWLSCAFTFYFYVLFANNLLFLSICFCIMFTFVKMIWAMCGVYRRKQESGRRTNSSESHQLTKWSQSWDEASEDLGETSGLVVARFLVHKMTFM